MKDEFSATLTAQTISFIDLRLDFAFHLIFGTEGNEDLLLKLVQAILPQRGIESVALINPVHPRLRKNARASVFDVSCKTSKDEEIIIEMQYRHKDDLNDRMIFYSTIPIYNKVKFGADSYRFNPVYVIGISDFILDGIESNMNLINYYSLVNLADSSIVFSENLHYVTVELPKMTKRLEEIDDDAELLFYAIKNIGGMKEMPRKYVGSGLEKLFELCKFAAMDEKMQLKYLRELMADVDARSEKRTAYNMGKAEGMAEGIAEERKAIALELKKIGLSAEQISSVTGLSLEQVAEL